MTWPAAIDWPAWVQAVGSIAAILIAVWIAHRDSRVARAAKRERLAEISALLIERSAFTLTFMGMIEKELAQPRGTAEFHGKVRSDAQTVARQMARFRKFEEMKIADWPALTLFTAFSRMYDELTSLERAMREYADSLAEKSDQGVLDAQHNRAELFVGHTRQAIVTLRETAALTANARA